MDLLTALIAGLAAEVIDTPVWVAIIGAGVTVLGFIISGTFGLMASTTQRQDQITEQRLTFKDEQLNDCERDLNECKIRLEAAERRAAAASEEARAANIEAWEAKGRLHAAEVALLRYKTDQGEEHHQGGTG